MKPNIDHANDEDISEQLERYRNLALISTDWFWETDKDFVITYMSASVERITGFPKEKYIGVSRHDLASEETKQTAEWKEHLELVSRHEPIKNFEYKHVGDDGFTLYLRINAIPLFNDDGSFRGYLGSTSDISELVLARKHVEDVNKELGVAKEAAEKLARQDPLTGLYNRRAFFEHGAAIDDMVQRYGQLYSIVMLDIDHFKNVNDSYGHAVGDLALTSIASLMKKHARTSDIPARIGGEEFAIILPQTEMSSAVNLAERLRQAVEETSFAFENGEFFITVSLGVTECGESSCSVEEVILRADKALYQAKEQGRNRVVQLGID